MLIQDDMPKYEQAYYTLINRLKSNRYPVGSRIPTEGDLAQQFSMSRVTIRHALDMLVQDGYVEQTGKWIHSLNIVTSIRHLFDFIH